MFNDIAGRLTAAQHDADNAIRIAANQVNQLTAHLATINTEYGGKRATRPNSAALPAGQAWLIGAVTLLMAIVLVADGLYEGFVPGGREWSVSGEGAGWLVYLFASVMLVIAVRAVHGARLALRALLVVALILFLERSFTPFSLREQDPIVLALHGLAALVSLAVALTTANAIRAGRSSAPDTLRSLEAA